MTSITTSDAVRPRPAEAPKTSARLFLEAMVEHGVRVAFGIPGGAASPLFDALRSVPELRYVATRHEAGAAFAALGYARASGLPALVLTTSGPGLTNAITAMASAYAEELPMIVVAGEAPLRSYGKGALQDGTAAGWRAHETLRSITRWSGSLTPGAAPSAVAAKAFAESAGRRPGPVFVSVPLDVGSNSAATTHVAFANTSAHDVVDAAACTVMAQALSNASRPLLVLGHGARRAGPEATQLAERLGMPVAVTAHAKGVFPERHPLYLGVLGLGQHPSVDEYLSLPCDVSVVVGSGLDDLATNGWTLPLLGSRVSFQVDRDAGGLARSLPFTHGIVGDAARVLARVNSALPRDVAIPMRSLPRLTRLRPESAWDDAVPLKPPRVLRALAEAFPDAIWCSDIGEHLGYALHYLQVDDPDSFHNMLGFGSMGSGVGSSIGIQLVRRDRQVVCVCGDGGFAMMLAELLTCVEHQIPVVFAVMNDGRWNMVEHGFRTVYGKAPDGFVSVVADYAAIATAMGAVGVPVETPADLSASRLTGATATRGPVVLDIRIDANEALTPGTRAASIRHFCVETS